MRQDQTTFGECSLCRQGTLIAMKQSDEHSLVLVCDDCESQWMSPSEASSADKAVVQERTALVPATNEDLRKAGWR
jgi:hypothetical protein